MSATLLMRLAGPMQSWGTQSRFRYRDTGREPSKSGVLGLVCAALGRPREAPLDDLVALRLGVRVDAEGRHKTDYQTAGGTHRVGHERSYGVPRAENPGLETAQSWRYYLAGASFLVGLEAATPEQEALLAQIDVALDAPRWPLSLGRKSYVPGEPVRLPDAPPQGPGIRSQPLEVALREYPWPEHSAERLRVVLETDADDPRAEVREDQPLSFVSADRRFAPRAVIVTFFERPFEVSVASGAMTQEEEDV